MSAFDMSEAVRFISSSNFWTCSPMSDAGMDLKGIGPDNMPLDVFNGGADAVSQLDLGHVHRPLRASARADGVGVESLRRVSDISVYSEVCYELDGVP
ncbi:unnamed protein product (mitochondrion) [Plasmodiophora brassicae]|uniref:Uncharacterized protein n=1 Tax=Plasmodiophora brassicae TaxID=37360 RepID=A0A3P3YJJ3_PLABS|nr:unnamed protein product [Plasmodiophora brassicae]